MSRFSVGLFAVGFSMSFVVAYALLGAVGI
jgi:hypothetical protein